MDFPNEKGTYVLIAAVPQMKRVEVGQLGQFDIVPGFYAYVGSAFGAGGLAARIGHHLESAAAPHWHIDYLLQVAKPGYSPELNPQEHVWDEVREKAFPNLVLDQMALVVERLKHGMGSLAADAQRVRGITAWPWIVSLNLKAN